MPLCKADHHDNTLGCFTTCVEDHLTGTEGALVCQGVEHTKSKSFPVEEQVQLHGSEWNRRQKVLHGSQTGKNKKRKQPVGSAQIPGGEMIPNTSRQQTVQSHERGTKRA